MLIYDCEIIKAIPTKGERIKGIEYCDGWRDFKNMGIACIAFSTPQTLDICVNVPLEKLDFNYLSIQDFAYRIHSGFDLFKAAVETADIICGFNSKGFDDNLCAENGLEVKTNYDLLEEVRLAAYGSTDYRDAPKGYSYSLGKLAEANGYGKSLSGELAPIYWQKGRYKEVIDYCVGDVEITEAIFDLGLAGNLKDPNCDRFLQLRSVDEVIGK